MHSNYFGDLRNIPLVLPPGQRFDKKGEDEFSVLLLDVCCLNRHYVL